MWIIKYKWIFFSFSGLLVAGAIFMLVNYGLRFGIDFTGGTIVQVEYENVLRPTPMVVEVALAKTTLGPVTVQPSGERELLIRLHTLSEAERLTLLDALPTDGAGRQPLEKRFSAIGPSLGQELARKGFIALGLSILLILIYIAISFRSWRFSAVAVLKLIHDLVIVVGVFAWLGLARGAEVDSLFLAAFLTILGLSVNDVIAVFDRIRENLRRAGEQSFATTVGRSLSETMGRSINTSLTVIFVLLSLFFLGGSTTRDFVLALTIGMVTATYSSIFIASPLLVVWEKFARR